MNRRNFLKSAAALAATASLASPASAATARSSGQATRPAAATTPASKVPDDLGWHDVRDWGVEGRGFTDTASYFDRLPGRARGVVRSAVWHLSQNTSGMTAFFEADAPEIYVRYTLTTPKLAMPHMPATGVSGVDLYGKGEHGWQWLATHLPEAQGVEARLIDGVAPDRRAYHLNLPLYNGVKSIEIGVPKGTRFTPTAPRQAKPILFYGTSITQGACASRPGMSFVSILGRRLDRPMLNFGFSGNGKTELEVARILAELDPAIFVIDTVANTPAEQIRERMDPLVRILRNGRPATPVLLLGERRWDHAPLVPRAAKEHIEKFEALRAAHETLRQASVSNVHLRAGDDLIGNDHEATVDGSHPNDLGMMRYANALEPNLRRLLDSAA